MDFVTTNTNDCIRIKLSGQFTFNDHQKFKSIIDMLEQENLRQLDMDFCDVTFIDSAGLGMMLLLRDSCQNKHITISIYSMGGQVEKIFLISKFDQLFSMKLKNSGM